MIFSTKTLRLRGVHILGGVAELIHIGQGLAHPQSTYLVFHHNTFTIRRWLKPLQDRRAGRMESDDAVALPLIARRQSETFSP